MQAQEITITPDPQILQVLSYLEMRPIDSLCELIDNAVDALAIPGASGNAIIQIELPTRKEVDDGVGRVRVRDNGPGMTLEQVQSALRAGYSSKSRYGSLGLFGVGFNIATAKLGRLTRLVTARAEDEFATIVDVDLVSLRKSGDFKVRAQQAPKPVGLEHGTLVDVSEAWGPGNQNAGFLLKLVSIGRPRTLQQIGRTYSSLLRSGQIRILVGGDEAQPYFPCVWGDNRSVEHAKHGVIPAVLRYQNHVIHTYRQCADCERNLDPDQVVCDNCQSQTSVTREERISGWVGVQRYQDASHFGIDLIRNGRAIRVQEKQAFFEFVDPETGTAILDYPIDNSEGRIVGEIHLDHVPVDPAKQNFERSSPEWRRAIEFLRGQSSLQPERPGAASNQSPIFRLYQGYRKVRGPGKRSMYMGKWVPSEEKPRLLSKSEIEELLAKFAAREQGFFDDAEWWKRVELADQKPVPGLKKCPSCFAESPENAEECPHCLHIFVGKTCVNENCAKLIPISALSCAICGTNQIPVVETPWACAVCSRTNLASDTVCQSCSHPRGTPNPTSLESLLTQATHSPQLSTKGLSIPLASGQMTAPIDVECYLTGGSLKVVRADGSTRRLPSIRYAKEEIQLFIDPTHPWFEQTGISIEQHVAIEAGAFIYVNYLSQASRFPVEHSVAKLASEIFERRWPGMLSPAEVNEELTALFATMKIRLAEVIGDQAEDVYNNLSQEERTALASEVVRKGIDLGELSELKATGQFVHYIRPKGVVEIFRIYPGLFFDGKVWSVTYQAIPQLHPEGWERLQSQIRSEFGSLLELAAVFAHKRPESPSETAVARAVCKLAQSKVTG